MRHFCYPRTSEVVPVSDEAGLFWYAKDLGRFREKMKGESMGRHLKYLFHRH